MTSGAAGPARRGARRPAARGPAARRAACAAALAALLAGAAGPARAAGDEAAPTRWIALGVLSGATGFDAALADYRWDVAPRAAWGVQALAGRGALAAGLRAWRAGTTQETGVPGAGVAPRVRATSVELVARARLATVWGTRVHATAGAGRLHLAYAPDRVTLAVAGGGAPVEVAFDPVNAWIGGAGLALERPVAGPWSAALELDRRVFGMDAAHRRGDEIVVERETFGDWSARAALAWRLEWPR